MIYTIISEKHIEDIMALPIISVGGSSNPSNLLKEFINGSRTNLDVPALSYGTIVHMVIYEPEEFETTFTVTNTGYLNLSDISTELANPARVDKIEIHPTLVQDLHRIKDDYNLLFKQDLLEEQISITKESQILHEFEIELKKIITGYKPKGGKTEKYKHANYKLRGKLDCLVFGDNNDAIIYDIKTSSKNITTETADAFAKSYHDNMMHYSYLVLTQYPHIKKLKCKLIIINHNDFIYQNMLVYDLVLYDTYTLEDLTPYILDKVKSLNNYLEERFFNLPKKEQLLVIKKYTDPTKEYDLHVNGEGITFTGLDVIQNIDEDLRVIDSDTELCDKLEHVANVEEYNAIIPKSMKSLNTYIMSALTAKNPSKYKEFIEAYPIESYCILKRIFENDLKIGGQYPDAYIMELMDRGSASAQVKYPVLYPSYHYVLRQLRETYPDLTLRQYFLQRNQLDPASPDYVFKELNLMDPYSVVFKEGLMHDVVVKLNKYPDFGQLKNDFTGLPQYGLCYLEDANKKVRYLYLCDLSPYKNKFIALKQSGKKNLAWENHTNAMMKKVCYIELFNQYPDLKYLRMIKSSGRTLLTEN